MIQKFEVTLTTPDEDWDEIDVTELEEVIHGGFTIGFRGDAPGIDIADLTTRAQYKQAEEKAEGWTRTRYGYAREYGHKGGVTMTAPDRKRTMWFIGYFTEPGSSEPIEEFDVEAVSKKAASSYLRETVIPEQYEGVKLGKVVLA